MNKRGQIWISAALYTAMGIILIGLILSVGMPFVNKVKMRNTLLQTKNVMYDMDKLIRDVWNEGLGSRRPIFIEIKEGQFVIDEVDDKITWSVIASDKLGIEPDLDPMEEGNLLISSIQLGEGFNIKLELDYKDNIELKTTAGTETLSGAYNLVIEHTTDCGDKAECVKIREAGIV